MAKSKNQGCTVWPFYLGLIALAFYSFIQQIYLCAGAFSFFALILIFFDGQAKSYKEKQRAYEKKREDWNRAHARPFEERYKIKGLNFHTENIDYIGEFIGTAKACRFNEHDPYAVAIFVDGKQIGHFPAGQQFLHEQIMAKGGEVECVGYINCKEDEDEGYYFYYGRVWFEDVEK